MSSRNSRQIGALLAKTESKFDKARDFLNRKDEDAEKDGESVTTRLLRKGAKSFGTTAVFSADRNGVENTLDRMLRAYLILDPREAHMLAQWYVIRVGESWSEALVKAAKLATSNPNRPVWPMMATDEGIERRGDAAARILEAVTYRNRENAKITDETNRLRIAADAKINEVAFILIDAGLFGEAEAAEKIAGDLVAAILDGKEVTESEDAGGSETGTEPEGEVEVERPAGAPEAPVEEPAPEAKPKRETAKQRRAREAREVAAAKDPKAGLTGEKPAAKGTMADKLQGVAAELGLGGQS